MADIKLAPSVSLTEATDLVQHTGHQLSYLFLGEMGIGKSAMLTALGARMPEYDCVYAEVPTFDTGDVTGIPFTEVINGVKVTRFAPNYMMHIHSDRPMLFMADELGKGPRPVQNTFLRVFHERKIGEFSLPKGSIVFATSNLAAEGLGDHVQDHLRNRGSVVPIRKPNAAEWVAWAMANGIHPIVIAWVKRFPMCLDSYTNGVEGNAYIFYPGKTTKAFVTPRSLQNASHIMWQRDKITSNALIVALSGCVGDSAGRDLVSFAATNDRLPSWDLVVTTPATAAVPTAQDFAANFITVFSAITLVDRKTLTPFMEYCQRLPKEYQGVFALNILGSPKRSIALNNRAFVVWATQNEWMV